MGDKTYDIFISWHNDANDVGKRIADRLKVFIEHEMFPNTVSVFVSADDLISDWRHELSDALETSKYSIFILTPEAMDSFWMSYEYGVLSGKGKNIQAFRFSDINRAKTPFVTVQSNEFNEPNLLDFLMLIYRELTPNMLSINAFREKFYEKWLKLKHDIDSYTKDIDKEYKRSYEVLREFDNKHIIINNGTNQDIKDKMKYNEHAVYISYARNSNEKPEWEHIADIVEDLAPAIRKMGVTCYNDSDDIHNGDSITEFEEAIGNGECVILIYSERYFTRPHCMYELMKIKEGKESGKIKQLFLVNADKCNLERTSLRFFVGEWARLQEEYEYDEIEKSIMENAKKYGYYKNFIKNNLVAFFDSISHGYQKDILLRDINMYFFPNKPSGRIIKTNLPTAIDLGLSVLWADRNIGAEQPWENGDFFAWGETQSKTNHAWSNYTHALGAGDKIIKYCNTIGKGFKDFIDNHNILLPPDDAAVKILGEKWRMPTAEEYSELLNNCSWIRTKREGVEGYIVKSKKNHCSIFLPASGSSAIRNSGDGDLGDYWSSSLYSDPAFAKSLYFCWSEDSVGVSYACRCFGFPIRAVQSKA